MSSIQWKLPDMPSGRKKCDTQLGKKSVNRKDLIEQTNDIQVFKGKQEHNEHKTRIESLKKNQIGIKHTTYTYTVYTWTISLDGINSRVDTGEITISEWKSKQTKAQTFSNWKKKKEKILSNIGTISSNKHHIFGVSYRKEREIKYLNNVCIFSKFDENYKSADTDTDSRSVNPRHNCEHGSIA